MAQLDLEALREAVLDGREAPARPRERRRQVFVDPGGRVVIGDAPDDADARELSEVHLAVFA
jgi:hypothetical protein